MLLTLEFKINTIARIRSLSLSLSLSLTPSSFYDAIRRENDDNDDDIRDDVISVIAFFHKCLDPMRSINRFLSDRLHLLPKMTSRDFSRKLQKAP